MRRAPFWSAHACRRSTAALASGSISSQRLGFRPGFLGLGPNGRYPPSPVPVQGCTSHPGHRAGRLIPKPPGSSLQSRPRAPPSLPRRGVPPRHVLHVSEDYGGLYLLLTHKVEFTSLCNHLVVVGSIGAIRDLEGVKTPFLAC